MRVLIFQAATSAVAIAAMTRYADELRNAGHSGGLRSLPHFRREKEPADKIIVALKPSEAERFKNLGAELVAVFQDTDRILPVELPEEDDKLADFDFGDSITDLEDEKASMSMDQLRAEAIERGIEVTAETSREVLEHSLDIDQHPGTQAADRATDRSLMGDGTGQGGYAEDRIGVRTSTILPTVNGLDLERMNDEQLQAKAMELGIKVPRNARRETVIKAITKTFAEKTGAVPPADTDQEPTYDEGLADLDEAGLQKVAADETVDLGRATTVEGMTAKIVEARKAKAEGGGNG